MMRLYIGLLLAVYVFLAAGCELLAETNPSAIAVTADKNQYRIGDTAVIAIENRHRQDLRISDCPWGLERQTGSGWQVVDATYCTGLHFTIVRAGETGEIHVPIRWHESVSAEAAYRIKVNLGVGDGLEMRSIPGKPYTQTFSIVPE